MSQYYKNTRTKSEHFMASSVCDVLRTTPHTSATYARKVRQCLLEQKKISHHMMFNFRSRITESAISACFYDLVAVRY